MSKPVTDAPGVPELVEIAKDFTFESAHYLPGVGREHRCSRVHGHTYRVSVHVRGPLDPEAGWVMDFHELSAAFEPLRRELDHHLLNDVPGLEVPTAEHIARWIWRRLDGVLPGLCQVTVYENPTSRAILRRD